MIAAATLPSVMPACASQPVASRRVVCRPVSMMDSLPELAFGAMAATGLAFGAASLRGLLTADQEGASTDASEVPIGLEERLRDAAATRAQTYREVSDSGGGTSSEVTPEQAERRKAVLARANAMLDEVRADAELGIEEAQLNGDADQEFKYRELLDELNPLPPGIVPTSKAADFQRWIDPNSLKG
jgi:hypothetical protein